MYPKWRVKLLNVISFYRTMSMHLNCIFCTGITFIIIKILFLLIHKYTQAEIGKVALV